MRPVTFAISRTFHGNPNYRTGTYAKQRAGLEVHVERGIRQLPKVLMQAKAYMSDPVLREIAQELADGHPSGWVRPKGRGLIHLPWESVPAARAWLRRLRRFIRWTKTTAARYWSPRNALRNALAKTMRAEENSSRRDAQAEIERAQAFYKARGLPWVGGEA